MGDKFVGWVTLVGFGFLLGISIPQVEAERETDTQKWETLAVVTKQLAVRWTAGLGVRLGGEPSEKSAATGRYRGVATAHPPEQWGHTATMRQRVGKVRHG